MNIYPLWKYLIVIAVVTIGLLFATPNLFSPDPALQVSSTSVAKIDADTANRVEAALRGSEEKFRSLVEHLPETIVYTTTLDAESTITYVSPQVGNLL